MNREQIMEEWTENRSISISIDIYLYEINTKYVQYETTMIIDFWMNPLIVCDVFIAWFLFPSYLRSYKKKKDNWKQTRHCFGQIFLLLYSTRDYANLFKKSIDVIRSFERWGLCLLRSFLNIFFSFRKKLIFIKSMKMNHSYNNFFKENDEID